MVSQADIARDWKVSAAYVSKKVKEGCPTDSLENARLWRAAHASSKGSTSRSRIQEIVNEKEDDSPEARERRKKFLEGRESSSLPKDLTIEETLQHARYVAAEAYRLVEEAMMVGKASVIAPLVAIHNKALESLWKSEQSYREELERRNILIEVDKANELARRGWDIVISRLSSLPQNMAARVNPHDPNHAMDLLQHECTAIVADVRKVFSPQLHVEHAPAS